MIQRVRLGIYRFKRVAQMLLYLRSNFSNWDEIVKRALSGKQVQVIKTRGGLIVEGVDSNILSIYKEIFADKVYNPAGFEINDGDTVLDIGANIGLFTLYASRTRNVKVLAFEPHPKNFEILSRNAASVKCNIRCFELAIADDDGERILHEGFIPGGHKIDSVTNGGTYLDRDIRIKTRTLRSIFRENGLERVHFLKLDCEGAEGEIMRSSHQEDLKKIDKVVMEFHDNASCLNHNQIVDKLNSAGFVCQLKWDGKSNYGYIYARR